MKIAELSFKNGDKIRVKCNKVEEVYATWDQRNIVTMEQPNGQPVRFDAAKITLVRLIDEEEEKPEPPPKKTGWFS